MNAYRNLRRGCWSLQTQGLPVEHCDELFLRDAAFIVQAAGNARVRRERRKNVHAFVRSNHRYYYPLIPRLDNGWEWVTYDPYRNTSFVDSLGRPVQSAKWVHLTPSGEALAHGLVRSEGDLRHV